MPITILMPALSPTMKEGNLAKWTKKEGDKISPGEVIAEIETDKATMELEAVDEGILGKILIAQGSREVAVGSPIALLLEEGEEKSALDNFKPTKPPSKEERSEATAPVPALEVRKESAEPKKIFASPLAKNLARLKGLDLSKIKGSGPYGRVIKADVEKSGSGATVKNFERAETRLVPHDNIRRIIAKRLSESKRDIPHFYLSIECSVDNLLKARSDLNEEYTGKDFPKLSVNDFVILACAKALREVPEANSSWTEEGVIYYGNVDISVAVAIEGGLVTPIITKADEKNIFSLSGEMKELSDKAKKNKLRPEEFQGGNFTISNLGMFGIKNFAAIINPPQSCILAVGAATKRPIVSDEGTISVATITEFTLSCDHRVVDGAVGSKFLAAFKKYIEKPVLALSGF